MSACRPAVLACTALIALLLTRNSLAQSDSVDLGKSRVIIVKIPAGSFRMGSDQAIHADNVWKACPTCAPRNEVERPVHQVTISKDFWMSQFDITQRQWQDVMGNNPSFNQSAGPNAPVEQVSWKDVQSFLAKVNAMQTLWTLRLPTEAEWEYAARAGSTGEIYGPLDEVAWYGENANSTTHPVGQKKPNAFGLYDMLGNVWQWCQDWFADYPGHPVVDPQGSPTGDKHPTRGGCYYCDAIHERAARRNRDLENHSSRSIGFRVVAVPRKPTLGRTEILPALGVQRAESNATNSTKFLCTIPKTFADEPSGLRQTPHTFKIERLELIVGKRTDHLGPVFRVAPRQC